MSTRTHVRLGVAGILGAIVLSVLVVPLLAQPQFPSSPSGKNDKMSDLVVPPGVYSSFVFALEGGQSARFTLKTVSGTVTVVVAPNETVVLPMPPNFTLGQQATIAVVPSAGGHFSAAGITPSGPVSFEPAKK